MFVYNSPFTWPAYIKTKYKRQVIKDAEPIFRHGINIAILVFWEIFPNKKKKSNVTAPCKKGQNHSVFLPYNEWR